MPKSNAALAGALSMILLSACSGREAEPPANAAAGVEGNAAETASPSDPAEQSPSANGSVDPVPPPDAVSHPDGYLPPAPAEPGANSSDTDPSPPATEDEYMRNRQAGG